MKKKVLLFLTVIALFSACKKEEIKIEQKPKTILFRLVNINSNSDTSFYNIHSIKIAE